MKRKKTNTITQNKDIIGVFIVTAAILAVPLIAMQFTNEVAWSLFDFIFMGALISVTGILMVLASRKIKNINQKAVVIILLLIAFLLIWTQLAVGIVSAPFSGS